MMQYRPLLIFGLISELCFCNVTSGFLQHFYLEDHINKQKQVQAIFQLRIVHWRFHSDLHRQKHCLQDFKGKSLRK